MVAGARIELATRGFSTQSSLDPKAQHNSVLTFTGDGSLSRQLFEEPSNLEEAAIASEWFAQKLQ